MITFVPLEEIAEYEKLSGSELNVAKERLAYELTKLVHSEEEAQKALDAARALFSNNQNTDNMPTTELSGQDFTDGAIGILDLLVKCALASSKGDARRLVEQGGVSVDDEKVTDTKATVSLEAFQKGHVIIKKGKKVFHKQ